ncbi:hypothetical protein BSKO_02275 [Bryopsis sp. KO-2023]|nr:hypothetical protein BSKO_02275 [Bryopsis sp. KO-2023]
MVLSVVRTPIALIHKNQSIFRGATATGRARVPRLRAESGDDLPPRAGKSEEKFVSIRDVVKEASSLGNDFIFSDDGEDPVWEHEGNFKAPPPQEKENTPQVKNALDPNAVDITSAYSPEQGFKEISVSDLHGTIQDYPLVLDVRSVEEFESGHVPEAVNLPLPDLNKESIRVRKLEGFQDKRVAVICASGKRSAQATVRLSKVLGFIDVSNVQGGTLRWISEGLPVKR